MPIAEIILVRINVQTIFSTKPAQLQSRETGGLHLMKRVAIALAALCATAVGLPACSTDDNGPPTQCDTLARSTLEPGSNGHGVRRQNVDVERALAACTEQVKLTPNHAPTQFR